MSYHKVILFFTTILYISFANAEIYSWVDENGRKHFGNVIPHEYSSQIEVVPVDIDTPTDEEISNAEEINETIKSAGTIERRNDIESRVNSKSEPSDKVSKICLKKRKEYLDSMSCLDSCVSSRSTEMVTYREKITKGYAKGKEYIAFAPLCNKCRVVTKPDC